MNSNRCFEKQRIESISALGADANLQEISRLWIQKSGDHKYAYNFSWLGRPIIQLPQDIIALQELIWSIRPTLIIETGIAHGGSLVFYASMLELLGGEGYVIGIDIDIREHNRVEIETHPMYKRIKMISGSSIDEDIIQKVYRIAKGHNPIMIILDSNHTHNHVLNELEHYSPLIRKGSYLVVLDTVIEDLPNEFFSDRPWGKGNNPKTAVWEFLKKNDRFVIDTEIENKLLITVAPNGYLRCIRNML